jgi:WD40 repeat protein
MNASSLFTLLLLPSFDHTPPPANNRKALILIDGLDEVNDRHIYSLLKHELIQLPTWVCYVVTGKEVLISSGEITTEHMTVAIPDFTQAQVDTSAFNFAKAGISGRVPSGVDESEVVTKICDKAKGNYLYISLLLRDHFLSTPTKGGSKVLSTTDVAGWPADLDGVYKRILSSANNRIKNAGILGNFLKALATAREQLSLEALSSVLSSDQATVSLETLGCLIKELGVLIHVLNTHVPQHALCHSSFRTFLFTQKSLPELSFDELDANKLMAGMCKYAIFREKNESARSSALAKIMMKTEEKTKGRKLRRLSQLTDFTKPGDIMTSPNKKMEKKDEKEEESSGGMFSFMPKLPMPSLSLPSFNSLNPLGLVPGLSSGDSYVPLFEDVVGAPAHSFLQYAFHHIVSHAISCHDWGTMRSCLTSLEYLEARVAIKDAWSLPVEYSKAVATLQAHGNDELLYEDIVGDLYAFQRFVLVEMDMWETHSKNIFFSALSWGADSPIDLNANTSKPWWSKTTSWVEHVNKSEVNNYVLSTLEGHEKLVDTICFAEKENLVMTVGADFTLRVWEITSGEEILIMIIKSLSAQMLTGSYGCKIFLANEFGAISVMDLKGTKIKELSDDGSRPVTLMSSSEDGSYLAVAYRDNVIRIWNLDTMTLEGTITGLNSTPSVLKFSEDGKRLFCGMYDGSISIVVISTKDVHFILQGHRGAVISIVESPDCNCIISTDNAGAPGSLYVWDAGTGRPRAMLLCHEGRFKSLHFSPNGRYVVVGMSGKIVVQLEWKHLYAAHNTLVILVSEKRMNSSSYHWSLNKQSINMKVLLPAAISCIRQKLSASSKHFTYNVKSQQRATFDSAMWTCRFWAIESGIEHMIASVKPDNLNEMILHDGQVIDMIALQLPNYKQPIPRRLESNRLSSIFLNSEPQTTLLSRSGKMLAVSCTDNSIRIWDAPSALLEKTHVPVSIHTLAAIKDIKLFFQERSSAVPPRPPKAVMQRIQRHQTSKQANASHAKGVLETLAAEEKEKAAAPASAAADAPVAAEAPSPSAALLAVPVNVSAPSSPLLGAERADVKGDIIPALDIGGAAGGTPSRSRSKTESAASPAKSRVDMRIFTKDDSHVVGVDGEQDDTPSNPHALMELELGVKSDDVIIALNSAPEPTRAASLTPKRRLPLGDPTVMKAPSIQPALSSVAASPVSAVPLERARSASATPASVSSPNKPAASPALKAVAKRNALSMPTLSNGTLSSGKAAVVGLGESSQAAALFAAESADSVKVTTPFPLLSRQIIPTCLTISYMPGSETTLVTGSVDHIARIRSGEKMEDKSVFESDSKEPIVRAFFSATLPYIVTGGVNDVMIWNGNTGAMLRQEEGAGLSLITDSAHKAALYMNKGYLYILQLDRDDNAAQKKALPGLSDNIESALSTGDNIRAGRYGRPTLLALSPHNKILLVVAEHENCLRVYSFPHCEPVNTIVPPPGQVVSAVLSTHDFVIMASGHHIHCYNLQFQLAHHMTGCHIDDVSALAVTEHQKMPILASGGADGLIALWDLKTGLLLSKMFLRSSETGTDKLTYSVANLSWSASGLRLAVMMQDNTFRLLEFDESIRERENTKVTSKVVVLPVPSLPAGSWFTSAKVHNL